MPRLHPPADPTNPLSWPPAFVDVELLCNFTSKLKIDRRLGQTMFRVRKQHKSRSFWPWAEKSPYLNLRNKFPRETCTNWELLYKEARQSALVKLSLLFKRVYHVSRSWYFSTSFKLQFLKHRFGTKTGFQANFWWVWTLERKLAHGKKTRKPKHTFLKNIAPNGPLKRC